MRGDRLRVAHLRRLALGFTILDRLDGLGVLHPVSRTAPMRSARIPRTAVELVIDEMTGDHAQDSAHATTGQSPERAAEEFPRPFHAAILPIPGDRPERSRASVETSPPVRVDATADPASTSSGAPPVHTTALRHLRRIHAGKVRDIYEVDADHMLIVTTDRLSAFDVVLPDPIPQKGRVLTEISDFWFRRTTHIVPNQLSDMGLDALPLDPDERLMLAGRAVIVKRLKALPIEAVVRGYLIGSGWKDYLRTGAVCGITLPAGLELASPLPQPLFTPASKAPAGQHDENIDFAEVERLIGPALAAQVRDTSLALYAFAAEHARARGLIIADTKFEFGLDAEGRLTLIDEVITPDSSRFWPADTWRPGASPPSFDKQFVRDHLETLDWDKTAPGPALPPEIIDKTSAKYMEALRRLTGPTLGSSARTQPASGPG